ncbi:MAG: DUF4878 domain-containing protein [Candidatus Kuenenia sp.]|nr:DUF4878 domain-containing protein [Candidatus Kuenenia hertensis]
MKRMILILFVAIIAFAGHGYAQDSPRMVVEKYLSAVRNNDYDRAYSYISKTDTTIIDWLEIIKYVKEIAPPKLTRVIDLAHGATVQEVVSASVNDNTAIVKLHSIVPDMKETLQVIHDPDEIQFLFEQGGLPVKERLGECKLVVEDDTWKISEVKGVSAGQAAEIATDFAEKILGKDEAEIINKKIDDFVKKQEKQIL